MLSGPMDFTSPIKVPKKSCKMPFRTSILSPRTLDRISRPRRQREISPTPVQTTRKMFKTSSPRKVKLSQSAGVLKRLQKTEVKLVHSVPSKKVRRPILGRVSSQQTRNSETVGIDDTA